MKALFLTLIFSLITIFSAVRLEWTSPETYGRDVNSSRVVTVEFWAQWNQENAFNEYYLLSGARNFRYNVETAPEFSFYTLGVKTIPTMIIYRGGEEVYRCNPNVTLRLDCSTETIQSVINYYLVN